MNRQNGNKLNQVFQNWKYGTVAVSEWFDTNNVDRKLLNQYYKSGWVKRISSGAYIKPGDQVDWTGGLFAVQKQLNLPIHVGGKTALILQGLSHYLSPKISIVHLYGEPSTKLPTWVKVFFKQNQLEFYYYTINLFNIRNIGFRDLDFSSYQLTVSAPERAIMELLYHVPEKQTFDEADKIMEGLLNLRPDLVNQLLQECTSIKVKRLFLYLAEKNNLPCFKQINLKSIYLGKGKRSIVTGGIFDKKYNITVPKQELLDESIF